MFTNPKISILTASISLISQIIVPQYFGLENNANEVVTLPIDSLMTFQNSALVQTSNPDTQAVNYCRWVIVTAYSSTSDQTDDSPFVTASGTTVRDGIVATNFLKFGTRVRFPEIYGDKVFIVEDRMAPKNSHKVDIWFETREEAKQFGVKWIKIEVLET